MKRLKLLMLAFCLAVSLPLAYVVHQTYSALAMEERAQLQFFSEALFDEMEAELTHLVRREENRAVDAYNYTLSRGQGKSGASPLRKPPEDFILGYLQNNPDGSFQTPMVVDMARVPTDQQDLVEGLKSANTIFNSKKFSIPAASPPPEVQEAEAAPSPAEKKSKAVFAERYLSSPQKQSAKSRLGRQTVRKEEISVGQAINLAKEDDNLLRSRRLATQETAMQMADRPMSEQRDAMAEEADDKDVAAGAASNAIVAEPTDGFQVEVAPFQSVFISDGRFFIFRRIAINQQIYRQGLILQSKPFLSHLARSHFQAQPMARFAELNLQVVGHGGTKENFRLGTRNSGSDFIARRTFPPPFDFLRADLHAGALPRSPARNTLNVALSLLAAFMLLGLLAIYQSARTVMDLSERRSQFVSSVTHELKTPLTNIRMYVEMLSQGIAATPEREHEYLDILGSESSRLSRLINNVLELAKLEKKQRHFKLEEGNLQDLLKEVRTIMAHKLAQEGFQLEIQDAEVPPFVHDREVLLQILINLVENSIKFGRNCPNKRIAISARQGDGVMTISVSDTGSGIPKHALKKIFDDFYRVDNDLTRATGGTGIGLSLVKKFVTALGGSVKAENNDDEGCTITITLPQ